MGNLRDDAWEALKYQFKIYLNPEESLQIKRYDNLSAT